MANVRMKAPKGFGSVSWGGKEYAASKGFVVVPEESVRDVLAHGPTLEDDGAPGENGKQGEGSQP